MCNGLASREPSNSYLGWVGTDTLLPCGCPSYPTRNQRVDVLPASRASRRYKPKLCPIWEEPSDGSEGASIVDEKPAVDNNSSETVGEKPVVNENDNDTIVERATVDNTSSTGQGSNLVSASSGEHLSQRPRRKRSFWRRLLRICRSTFPPMI